MSNTVLLHIEIDENKHLQVVSAMKNKKDLINLLTDVLKLVNNKEESSIIIPGG